MSNAIVESGPFTRDGCVPRSSVPSILRFAGLVALLGCERAAVETTPICRTGTGLTGTNGWSTNGYSTNGYSTNGYSLNGYSLNGYSLNGITVHDTTINGAPIAGVVLERSTLVAVGDDGGILGPIDAVGATIRGITDDGSSVALTITGMEQDGELTLYSLALDRTNICGDGGKGLFVKGIWDDTGRRHETLGEGESLRDTTFSCTSGVIAKCVAWGYQPWSAGTDLHQTCTRMARADYCGDGQPHTENGTLIDLYDANGIQVPTLGTDLVFEAGWGPDGAVCVHKTRYGEIGAEGDVVLPSCWRAKPTCETFDEAIDRGASIGNASGYAQRYLCEDR